MESSGDGTKLGFRYLDGVGEDVCPALRVLLSDELGVAVIELSFVSNPGRLHEMLARSKIGARHNINLCRSR